ncbi:MAG TPA: GvpL/GvpF family gas vesicle protein [Actinomycetes bacterium]
MATYVYAITRRPAPERLRGMRGVSGEPVRTIEHGGLSAIVGSVDPRRFSDEPARGGEEELRALEGLLRAHHRVVQALAGDTTVLPLRLGTVYRGDERVEALLEERRAEFEATLERIAGRTEWGVKLLVDPAVFDAEPEDREPDAGPAAGAGTRYLLRRRAEERSRQRRRDRAAALADQVHAALDAVAAASRRHAPQDARLSGHRGWMPLNGAYLVDQGRDRELLAVVRRFDDPERGIRLELTGPWAPYSFAEEERA